MLVALAAILFCMLVSGFPVSVLRAGIMGSVFLAAVALGRPRSIPPSLALSATVMAGINQKVLGQISFQLNFTALAGIVIVLPFLYKISEAVSLPKATFSNWLKHLELAGRELDIVVGGRVDRGDFGHMVSGGYEFRPAASLEYPGDIAGFTRHAIHPSGGSSNLRVGTGAPGVGPDSRMADLCAPFIPIGVSIVPAGDSYPWALDRNACDGGLVRVVSGLAVRAGPGSSRTGNGCPSHIGGKPYFW